jgi:hypothetical protein
MVWFRDDSEGKRVKRICAFYDDRWSKNRSVTDVDWSPKVSLNKGLLNNTSNWSVSFQS